MSLPAETEQILKPAESLNGQFWLDELHPDLLADMDTVVALSGVRNWIQLVRVPQVGKLDIEATSQNIGLPLTYLHTAGLSRGQTYGLSSLDTEEPLRVNLRPGRTANAQRFTMGHELGHLFLEALGYNQKGYTQAGEDFCDAVGREITMPIAEIDKVKQVDRQVLNELVEAFGVPVDEVVYRLMRAGKLPRKVAIDSGLGTHANEIYAGIITRTFVCLDCNDGRNCASADYDIPVFDYSEEELWGSMSSCMTEPDYFWRPSLHIPLTAQYFPRGMQTVLFSKNDLLKRQQTSGQHGLINSKSLSHSDGNGRTNT